mmetsp:Transcript_35731/g.64539  ORF Transcript_35731/g.64539 Transcript_35731/m.64539 type:complete len:82 (-) Transcript_35731:48-293(-)
MFLVEYRFVDSASMACLIRLHSVLQAALLVMRSHGKARALHNTCGKKEAAKGGLTKHLPILWRWTPFFGCQTLCCCCCCCC